MACSITAWAGGRGFSESGLEAVRDGYKVRAGELFEAEKGKPLVIGKVHPRGGGERPAGTMRFAYSLTEHAAVNLWLGRDIASANEALAAYGTYFTDHPETIYDRDNFHWHSEAALRLIDFYGRNGSRTPGLLKPETEDKVLEAVWLYCKRRQEDQTRYNTKAEPDAEKSGTWYIYESENHHSQSFCTQWHFAKLARERPGFKNRRYDDGRNAAEHHQAWNGYLKTYFAERAKKGMFIEMMSRDYNQKSMKGVFNVYDFTTDAELKRRAGLFIDLYFTYWGQEQFDGISGGGKSRLYSDVSPGSSENGYLFFGVGGKPRFNSTLISAMTTGYRPPLVVVDIVCDVNGRGTYEVAQRPLGLAEPGHNEPPIYRMRTGYGGIARYSYCTPDFILGTTMSENRPASDWALISSQNRSHGVIFAGDSKAGILPQTVKTHNNRSYNSQWSVQKKGTLICQKLKANERSGAMRVWFSEAGLSEPIEEKSWVFAESGGAYAAVRVMGGGHHWEDGGKRVKGKWLYAGDDFSPVILEVGGKSGFASYEAFRAAVIGNRPVLRDGVLRYRGLQGDRFEFFTDQSKPPSVNGAPVNYAPSMVFDGPFLRSAWDSGVVTIEKGKRRLTLDFN